MTRRPPPRHRAPPKVWPLATCCALLGAASLGAAVAPRDIHARHAVPHPPAVVADTTDGHTSRSARPAVTPFDPGKDGHPGLITGRTFQATATVTTASRACRCAPRQPVATTPAATRTTPPVTTEPPVFTDPGHGSGPDHGPPPDPPPETTPPDDTQTPTDSPTTTPATTTAAVTTTAVTSAAVTTETTTVLPLETTAAETTEVTQEAPDV